MQKILVIGGGYPQACLIEALGEFGNLNVIVIDDRKYIPAYTFAEQVTSIHRYDAEAIAEWANAHLPDYVTSGGADKAVFLMAKVAEQLGRPTYVPSAVAHLPMNKEGVRSLLESSGLPVPKSVAGTQLRDFALLDRFNFPVVVKPDQGIGQTAVDRAETIREANLSISRALTHSGNQTAIVQEYIDGREIGVNGIVLQGQFRLLTTSYRNASRQRGQAFGVAMEKVYPALVQTQDVEQLKQILQAAVYAMGIRNAPIYAQVIQARNTFYIIEVMPRLGGGEDPRLVKAATGYDLARATAQLSMGQTPAQPVNIEIADKHVVLRFLSVEPGYVKNISGISDAKKTPGISSLRLFINKGSKVEQLKSSRERVGFILAVGKSASEAAHNAQSAEQKITIHINSSS